MSGVQHIAGNNDPKEQHHCKSIATWTGPGAPTVSVRLWLLKGHTAEKKNIALCKEDLLICIRAAFKAHPEKGYCYIHWQMSTDMSTKPLFTMDYDVTGEMLQLVTTRKPSEQSTPDVETPPPAVEKPQLAVAKDAGQNSMEQ
ncbi:Hypothetical predicted protein [Paramuricea clavata]|uniref:Uncharacterized protein n=1 Tax=Paramuricea clavata TaxID=317549 RepID=A0A7D9MCC6_PARCT|nr:Hypothetical predicted protein [Paramuricea clavata]